MEAQWWVSAVLAIGSYIAFKYIVPALLTANVKPLTQANMITYIANDGLKIAAGNVSSTFMAPACFMIFTATGIAAIIVTLIKKDEAISSPLSHYQVCLRVCDRVTVYGRPVFSSRATSAPLETVGATGSELDMVNGNVQL